MAFWAEHILYNGISSERFGLTVYNENGGFDEAGGTSFSLLRSSLRNGQKFAYLGTEERDPMVLEFSLVSEKALDAAMQGEIHRWLMGHNGYRELRILQADMMTLRVGCIFHELEFLQVGNETVGIRVAGECDSFCFRGNDQRISVSGSGGSFTVMNLSDLNEYIYPQAVIGMPSGGGDFSLMNETDNGRETAFTGLGGEEEITLDSFRKIITSSHGIRRLSAFNKKWIRLVPGKNVFTYSFTGGSGYLHLTVPVYKMTGQ